MTAKGWKGQKRKGASMFQLLRSITSQRLLFFFGLQYQSFCSYCISIQLVSTITDFRLISGQIGKIPAARSTLDLLRIPTAKMETARTHVS